ncbi:MAG: trypsin-like serine protease, partial [Myxococcales bacterium]
AGAAGAAPSLEQVGRLEVRAEGQQEWKPLCTATPIGRRKVLTARHCLLEAAKGSISFVRGVDPERLGERVLVDNAYLLWRVPSFATRGQDVAVMTLHEEIDGDLFRTGVVSDSDLGVPMQAVGFGHPPVMPGDTTPGRQAQRQLPIVLSALDGNPYDRLFGDHEGFVAQAPPYFHGLSAEALEDTYQSGPLAVAYEAFAGAKPGDGRTCHGDSGGPLLRPDGTIVGVVSSGIDPDCYLGDIFATFGPDAQALLADALADRDPCEGETAEGRCDGTIAIGCRQDPWPRHLLQLDCATTGKVCAVASGRVDCVTP